MDISRAFDLVDQKILLQKLNTCEIGVALNFIKSYLHSRLLSTVHRTNSAVVGLSNTNRSVDLYSVMFVRVAYWDLSYI